MEKSGETMKRKFTSLLIAATVVLTGCTSCASTINSIKNYKVLPNIEQLMEGTRCIKTTVKYNCETNSLFTRRGFGSGFVYKTVDKKSYLITARHVVDVPKIITKRDSEGNILVCILKSVNSSIVDSISDKNIDDDINLEVLVLSEKGDFAVLKADSELYVPPYVIGDPSNVSAGDTAYMIGFPNGMARVLTKGTVSNVKGFPLSKYGNITLLNINILQGMSGSPYFIRDSNYRLTLHGICFGALHDGNNGLNIGICVDIDSHLDEMEKE